MERDNNKIGLVKRRVYKEGKFLFQYTKDINGFEFITVYSDNDMDMNYKMAHDDIKFRFQWVDENDIPLGVMDARDSIVEKDKRFEITFSTRDKQTTMEIMDTRYYKGYQFKLSGILTEENIKAKADIEIKIIKAQESVDKIIKNGFYLD